MNAPCVVALGVLLALQVPAQPMPDFSGRWMAVEPAAVAGHELTIAQDDGTLTLDQVRLRSRESYDTLGRRMGPSEGEREVSVYRLDGATSIVRRSEGDGQQVRLSLTWADGRVRLRDVYPGSRMTVERTLTLDSRGRLVLEQRKPFYADSDPAIASGQVLETRRIVFEKR